MSDNREQMKKWLRVAGLIALYLIQVIGAVGGIFAIFGRENVIGYLEQYLPLFLIAVVIIGLYVWVAYAMWWTGREIWRGIRGWRQKREDSRRLRSLAYKVGFHRRHTYSLPVNHESAEASDALALIRFQQAALGKELSELSIPAPVLPEDPVPWLETSKWAIYLEVLLPLAVVGDIDEARMILRRLEQSLET